MSVIVKTYGVERLNQRIVDLSQSMRPAQVKRALRPAANLHRKTAKAALRKVIRSNRKNYPSGHPYRIKNTGTLLKNIKVVSRRRTLQVRSGAAHSYNVEFGHASRGASDVPGYPFFFKVLPSIAGKQLQLVSAKVQQMLDKAAR